VLLRFRRKIVSYYLRAHFAREIFNKYFNSEIFVQVQLSFLLLLQLAAEAVQIAALKRSKAALQRQFAAFSCKTVAAVLLG